MSTESLSADGFGSSTPVEEGYVRYYSSVQTLEPGQSRNLVEWVREPFDHDVDVVHVKGGQTVGGHHLTLDASFAIEEVGTVREYINGDQLSSFVVGAAGNVGEGTSGSDLPTGYVLRVYAGQGLFLQTHYINPSEHTIDVQSYIDVKLEDPSDDHIVLTLVSNASLRTHLPAASSSEDTVECVTKRDLELLMFSNHMHEYGTSIRTEAELPDGSMIVLQDDTPWDLDWQVEPNYREAFDAPIVLPAGSTLRTHCTWNNTTDEAIDFPDEMCVFTAFIEGETSFACADSVWSEVQGGAMQADDSTPLTKVGEGACTGDDDFAALPESRAACLALPRADISGCALPLLTGDAQCIVDCFEEAGVSNACGECYGAFLACNASQCATDCSGDPAAEACLACQSDHCCDAFEGCSGLGC